MVSDLNIGIYIHDIPTSNNPHLVLYADDTAIATQSKFTVTSGDSRIQAPVMIGKLNPEATIGFLPGGNKLQ